MKKLFAIVLLCTMALPALSSEKPEETWTYRASAGLFPTVPFIALPWVAIGAGLSAKQEDGETSKVDFPPYFSLEGIYSFNTRWSAGLNVGYCGFTASVYNADGTIKSTSNLILIPITAIGRCNYLYRPIVKLYGSIEGGIVLSPESSGSSVIPNFQLNPIGVEVGKKVFGLVEAGVGLNYFGARVGLGWRF